MKKKMKIRILNRNCLKFPCTINVRVRRWNFLDITLTLQMKSQLNITKKLKSQVKAATKNKKKKRYRPYDEISGEFKKIKPPMFNGEIEKGEEAEVWMSGVKNYF